MRVLIALVIFVISFVVPAAAWDDITMANRPEVSFPGPNKRSPVIVRQSPYPQSSRSASVWNGDACLRECNASCTWKMEYCVKASPADECRPHLDACDRSCQRSCRAWWQGPLLGFVDF